MREHCDTFTAMEEDERREAKLASARSLQPAFVSKHVSQHQLTKLYELHRRRLQVKSKIHNKLKDGPGKLVKKHKNEDFDREVGNSHVSNLKSQIDITATSIFQANLEQHSAPKAPNKPQKLFWGLDTKERWEMKANM